MMMKTATIKKTKGDHISYHTICAHNVKFNYFSGEILPDEELTPDESEIEHVQKCINEGYRAGELCMMVIDGNKEREVRGWWRIEFN